MNQIKQLMRVGMIRCANKNRRALMRLSGLAPGQSKLQFDAQNIVNTYTPFPYYPQTMEVQAPMIPIVQKAMVESSNGLLGLVRETGCGCAIKIDKNGDFATVTKENFTHALQFSKAEIDHGTFSINEVETVCSISIADFTRGQDSTAHSQVLEDTHSSCVSETETDIFIELPNSLFVGNSTQKEITSHSASF